MSRFEVHSTPSSSNGDCGWAAPCSECEQLYKCEAGIVLTVNMHAHIVNTVNAINSQSSIVNSFMLNGSATALGLLYKCSLLCSECCVQWIQSPFFNKTSTSGNCWTTPPINLLCWMYRQCKHTYATETVCSHDQKISQQDKKRKRN